MKRTIVLLLVLTLAAPLWTVGAAPASSLRQEPATQEEDFESDSPWEGDYDRVPPELCPPDGSPVGPLLFPPAAESREGQSRTGLFVNEQGETFAVVVNGTDPAAVQQYVDEVQVCFDLIITGEPLLPDPGGAVDEIREGDEEKELTPAEVGVELDFFGQFESGNAEEATAAIEELFASEAPATEWADLLRERGFGFISAAEYEPFLRGETFVDFIIDPTIAGGFRHFYAPVVTISSVIVRVSVAGGSGSVTARLYRLNVLKSSKTVTDGTAPETKMLSDAVPGPTKHKLCVHGNAASNKYSLSGRWTKSYASGAGVPAVQARCPL